MGCMDINGTGLPVGMARLVAPDYRRGILLNDFYDWARFSAVGWTGEYEIEWDDPLRTREVCSLTFGDIMARVERRLAAGCPGRVILNEISATMWALDLGRTDPHLVHPKNAPEATNENRCSA